MSDYVVPFLPKALTSLIVKEKMFLQILFETIAEEKAASAPLSLILDEAHFLEDEPEFRVAKVEEEITGALLAIKTHTKDLEKLDARLLQIKLQDISSADKKSVEQQIREKDDDIKAQKEIMANCIRDLFFDADYGDSYADYEAIEINRCKELSLEPEFFAANMIEKKIKIHTVHANLLERFESKNCFAALSQGYKQLVQYNFKLEELEILEHKIFLQKQTAAFLEQGILNSEKFLRSFFVQEHMLGPISFAKDIVQDLFIVLSSLNDSLLALEKVKTKIKILELNEYEFAEEDELKEIIEKDIFQKQQQIMSLVLNAIYEHEQNSFVTNFRKEFEITDLEQDPRVQEAKKESILNKIQGVLSEFIKLPKYIKIPKSTQVGATTTGVAATIFNPASALALGVTVAATYKGFSTVADSLATATKGRLSEKYASKNSSDNFYCGALNHNFGILGAELVRNFYIRELLALEEFLTTKPKGSKEYQEADFLYNELCESWKKLKTESDPAVFQESLELVARIKFFTYTELQKYELFANTKMFSKAFSDSSLLTPDTIKIKKSRLDKEMHQLWYLRNLTLPHNECDFDFQEIEAELANTCLYEGRENKFERLTIHHSLAVASNPSYVLQKWLLNEVLFSCKIKCQKEFNVLDFQGNTVIHKICRDNDVVLLQALIEAFINVEHEFKPGAGIMEAATGKGVARNHSLSFIFNLKQPNLDGKNIVELAFTHSPLQLAFIDKLKDLISDSVELSDLALDDFEKLFAFDAQLRDLITAEAHSLKKSEPKKYVEVFFDRFTEKFNGKTKLNPKRLAIEAFHVLPPITSQDTLLLTDVPCLIPSRAIDGLTKDELEHKVKSNLFTNKKIFANECSLVQAILTNNKDFVKEFLQIPDVKITSYILAPKYEGYNLLDLAVIFNYPQILGLLFSKLNGESKECARKALLLAAEHNSLDIIDFICKGNIDNIGGILESKTPESLIFEEYKTKAIVSMTKTRFSYTVYEQVTALHYLFASPNPDVATVITFLKTFCDTGKVISKGIAGETGYSHFTSAVDPATGNNALHILAQHCNNPGFFEDLLAPGSLTILWGADSFSDWRNKYGKIDRIFPYHLMGIVNNEGDTPADIAWKNSNFSMALFLLEHLEKDSDLYEEKKARIEQSLIPAAVCARAGVAPLSFEGIQSVLFSSFLSENDPEYESSSPTNSSVVSSPGKSKMDAVD